MMEFSTYYKMSCGLIRQYYYDSDEYKTLKNPDRTVSQFYLPSKQTYDANDDGLKQYAQDLLRDSNELATWEKFKGYKQPFHYVKPLILRDGTKKYRSHDSNIETFFKIFTNNQKIQSFDEIDKIEANWMRKCYNAGLIYSVKGEYNSYGYDFSNFYASMLADEKFVFPTTKGQQLKLNKIPIQMKTGYYHVKITSDDPTVKKLFSFSPHHVYTNISLKYAQKLQEKYQIKIDLITDVDHNAYIYLNKNLISSNKLFSYWYDAIIELKILFPKNRIIKLLSSSLWGHLSRKNIVYMKEQEAEKLNIGTSDECDFYNLGYYDEYDGAESYYKLHDMNKPYKYNLRLKCFLTAYGRVKTAQVAEQDIESVIRIHTDGICFNKEQSFNIKNFIPEAKTTGLLQFPIHRKQQLNDNQDDE
jgi:hypothetical protein